MIERFLSTYKDGFEVMLNPTERDRIVEEINRLKEIDKEHQRINGELREENKRLYEELEAKRHDKYITDLITENGVICMKNKELERLHSIIKEVREYIENPIHEMSVKSYQELLEILDKENEK